MTTTLVQPAFLSVPAYTKTLGPEVAGICELAGFAPDPEQRLALDGIFALNPDNSPAAGDAAIIAPRQNIKTGLFKQCTLGWLFVTDQRLIIWSAHEFSTAAEAHRDLADLLENCPALWKRVKTVSHGSGNEGIELHTGQRVKFKARTKTGGRGLSGDKVVLDEAFALQPTHMGSLIPTMSARPHGQVVYGSSAGLTASAVLRSIRDRGRPGLDPGLFYAEWTDDLPGECALIGCSHAYGVQGCRLDDVRRWERANSQLHQRIELAAVQRERRALPPEEFARERLGWWDEDPSSGGVFPEGSWVACADATSEIVGGLTFGLDIAVDRASASVGVFGRRPDGVGHAETVQNRPGTDWVVPFLVEVTTKNGGSVAIDPASPAGSLIDELTKAGVRVHTVSARDYAQACGAFYDEVRDCLLRHLAQPEMDAAVAGARMRDLAGGFAWDRRRSSVDITPLVAVTLAAWGFRTYGGGDLAGAVW